eukprot:s861_g15.t1
MGSQSEFQRQPQAGASSRLLPRYVVLYCADNAKVGMMGTSDRSKLWIMSRESTMEPQSLQKLREHAKKFGFRLTDLTSVPQLWKKDKFARRCPWVFGAAMSYGCNRSNSRARAQELLRVPRRLPSSSPRMVTGPTAEKGHATRSWLL